MREFRVIFIQPDPTRIHLIRVGCGTRADTATWIDIKASRAMFHEKLIDAIIDLRKTFPKDLIYMRIKVPLPSKTDDSNAGWANCANPKTGGCVALLSTFEPTTEHCETLWDWCASQLETTERLNGLCGSISEHAEAVMEHED